MKKIALFTLIILGCSNHDNHNTHDTNDTGARIIGADAGVGPEHIVPDENYEYACALTYVQIPYNNSPGDAGIEVELYSHRLWSMPVRRFKGSDSHWISIVEPYGSIPPELNNVDFSNPNEGVYAIITLNDGTELMNQTVRPLSRGSSSHAEWQICESYNCGPNGCQTYPEPDNAKWVCQSIFNADGLNKCPCIFNVNGYTYCDLKDDPEEAIEEAP